MKKQRSRLKRLFSTFSLDACLDKILTDLWSGSSSSLFHVSNRPTFFWFTGIINPSGMLYKSFSRLSPCKTTQVRTPGDSKVVSLRTDRCVTCVGPDVRRLISAINTGLNFNRSFFFFCSKAFSRTIFSLLFRASNHQVLGKKNKTSEFASQTFIPGIKFRTNPGLT